MGKKIALVLVSLIIGFVIGVLVTIFVYPYVFPPAVVNEQVANVSAKKVVASAAFYDQSKHNPIHWGRGNVSIYKGSEGFEVFINKNFEVGAGPAFHVYVSESSNIKSNAEFKSSISYDLGSLKSFKGSQVYKIPNTIDYSKIKSVVIWCKKFGQYITSADLQPAS